MARLGFVSPWARTALADHRDEITAGPDLTVSLVGASPGGPWTIRLYGSAKRPLVELFDHYGSAVGAYRAALAMLPETVVFRGCEVEVA